MVTDTRPPSAAAASPHDHPTEGPAATHPAPGTEAAELLDYRVRMRALPAELAPPGRYLSLEGSPDRLLVALSDRTTHIGRGLSADLRLDDERVSRRHAMLVRRGEDVMLLDDRSSNGTFVNGDRIVEAQLHDGDLISVGPVQLRYVVVGSSPARDARAAAPVCRLG
jgi:pSer/pThr/pTyr-binding forkhead associated (FHA) protein